MAMLLSLVTSAAAAAGDAPASQVHAVWRAMSSGAPGSEAAGNSSSGRPLFPAASLHWLALSVRGHGRAHARGFGSARGGGQCSEQGSAVRACCRWTIGPHWAVAAIALRPGPDAAASVFPRRPCPGASVVMGLTASPPCVRRRAAGRARPCSQGRRQRRVGAQVCVQHPRDGVQQGRAALGRLAAVGGCAGQRRSRGTRLPLPHW